MFKKQNDFILQVGSRALRVCSEDEQSSCYLADLLQSQDTTLIRIFFIKLAKFANRCRTRQPKWKEADVSRIHQQQRCGRCDGEGAELGGNVSINGRSACWPGPAVMSLGYFWVILTEKQTHKCKRTPCPLKTKWEGATSVSRSQ